MLWACVVGEGTGGGLEPESCDVPSLRVLVGAAHTYHHGNEGTDVTLFHDKLEHRDHGVNFDTSFFLLAPFFFKFVFLFFFLFLF
jgi:hypothetical protein